MSTYRNQREVYETARDIAQVIHNEREHVEPIEDLCDWYAEQAFAAADRECIFTQDNWDVVNLFRCDLEDYDVPPLMMCEDIDQFMATAAWHIWNQLIMEALDA